MSNLLKTWGAWVAELGEEAFLQGLMAGKFVQDRSASEWGGPLLYRKGA